MSVHLREAWRKLAGWQGTGDEASLRQLLYGTEHPFRTGGEMGLEAAQNFLRRILTSEGFPQAEYAYVQRGSNYGSAMIGWDFDTSPPIPFIHAGPGTPDGITVIHEAAHIIQNRGAPQSGWRDAHSQEWLDIFIRLIRKWGSSELAYAMEQMRYSASKLAAAGEKVMTMYHGTNQAAVDAILAGGQFLRSEPEAVAHIIEERYGLPRDSVWNHPRNEFGRGRARDPNVYFTGDRGIAVEYARQGSEVVSDCLNAAAYLIFDDLFDSNGDWTPDGRERKRRWMADEAAAHYRPVVLTVVVPWDFIHDTQWPGRADITYEWYVENYDDDENSFHFPAPLPASWIAKVEQV